MLHLCLFLEFQGLGVCFLLGKDKPTKIQTKEKQQDPKTSKEFVLLSTKRQHRKHSNFKKQETKKRNKKLDPNTAKTTFCSQAETKTRDTTQPTRRKKNKINKANKTKEEKNKQKKKNKETRKLWGQVRWSTSPDPKPSGTKNKNKKKQETRKV